MVPTRPTHWRRSREGTSKLSDLPLAVVTGAGGALGSAAASALAAGGFSVVAIDRRADASLKLPPDIRGETGDMTNQETASALIDRVAGELGPPAVLVNTVGAYQGGDALDTAEDLLDQMISVNLKSAWWASQAAGRHMAGAGGGSIILVAAKQGVDAAAGSAAYSVSKAGVVQLTRVLDAELHDRGIRVNAVVPRLIDTPANRTSLPASAMAHAVTATAIAGVIAFLAGADGSPVSGAIVPVYG
jgi:NAD(P)-dependent dehydrogenase (short-subunit alcohol dehydrogenase family)